MVLILLSLTVTVSMFVAAISMLRHMITCDTLIRSRIAKEDFAAQGQSPEQMATLSPLEPFLVVVLPDGTIVAQRVAGQV
jgi:hypothetical protein